MDERTWLTGPFEEHRTRLRAVAYRTQVPIIFRFTENPSATVRAYANSVGAPHGAAERFWPVFAPPVASAALVPQQATDPMEHLSTRHPLGIGVEMPPVAHQRGCKVGYAGAWRGWRAPRS